MRLLFVTQNLPFPINSGSRLRTSNLIKLLSMDHDVRNLFFPSRRADVAGFAEACPASVTYELVLPQKRTRLGRGLEFLTSPLLKRHEVIAGLSRVVETFRPEVVWLDYFFIGHYIPWFVEQGIPVIYGTHNAQTVLTRQQASAEKSLPGKLVLSFMALLHGYHERKFFKHARYVVCVSAHDLEYHARFIPRNRLALLPNFIAEEAYVSVPAYESARPYICFVGSMDNFQNAFGIKHFIRSSWDHVRASVDVKLLVIGRGASGDVELQELAVQHGNVQIHDDVESVVPFIKGALVSIVPLIHGSGTRLKVIESMICKSAIVSTTLGAEGIPVVNGTHILIADNPVDFAQQIIRLVQDEHFRSRLGENAFLFALENFGINAVRKTAQAIVADACSS